MSGLIGFPLFAPTSGLFDTPITPFYSAPESDFSFFIRLRTRIEPARRAPASVIRVLAISPA
jgi:hypothetical protein